MSPQLPYLLAAAGLFTVLLCVAALAVMRDQQHRARFEVRVTQQASSYGRAIASIARPDTQSTASAARKQAMLRILTWLVRFNPSQQERYPIAWWIVLPGALALARLLVAAAQIMVGSTVLLLVPVLWVLMVRKFYTWCNQRRLMTLYVQFPDVLAMLVRAVRVGIPITEGIRGVARESPIPTGPEFAIVVDQLTIGMTLPDALRELAERNQLAEYRFFATALALQNETGGGVSETLERLADVIRKRVELRSHARALSSEARTSIYILASLPVFSGGALAVLSPEYLATLFTDPMGQRVLILALMSLTTGIVAMRTIISRSLK
jgi:tight adherence protein B